MASSTDLNDIALPGPYVRDSAFGFRGANAIRDGVETCKNVIQYELDNEGKAASRAFIRANAVYYLNGAQYDLESQSREGKFPDPINIAAAGIIDITFASAIDTSDYGVLVQILHDDAAPAPLVCVVAGDVASKTTTSLRLRVYSVGSSPALTDPYGFTIAITYGL